MDLPKSGDANRGFGVCRGSNECDRARGPGQTASGLLYRAVMSGDENVEPMAAITAPERTAAQHQSLLHFVGAHMA